MHFQFNVTGKGAVSQPYTQRLNDPHSGNSFCRLLGAGLRQLPQRVREPLAGWREHRASAVALQKVRADTGVVGECAGG